MREVTRGGTCWKRLGSALGDSKHSLGSGRWLRKDEKHLLHVVTLQHFYIVSGCIKARESGEVESSSARWSAVARCPRALARLAQEGLTNEGGDAVFA